MSYERENSRHKLENIIISETFLTVGELRKIIAGLEGFILGKSKNFVIDVRKAFWIERMFEKWKINIPAGKQEGEASQIKRKVEMAGYLESHV